MAEHTPTTSRQRLPAAAPALAFPATVQPRQVIEDALYQLGVLADILGVIASADISGAKAICGTYIEYLAARQREQQDRIEHALFCMGRA